jgi:exosortase
MAQDSVKTVKQSALQEFVKEFSDVWSRLPQKGFFFPLLIAWLLLFQFYGNGTFGYIDTASLLYWMKNAYYNVFSDGQDAHGAIVLPAVLVLFWMKRRELLALPVKLWYPGILIVAFSLALHALGYMIQQPRISIVAMFLGAYGLIGLTWGSAWLKESFFPYLLFAFCIPISAISQGVTFPLRLLVSKIVWIISHGILRLPVQRVGTQLFNSGYAYDVAAACSGIQSLMAIVGLNTVIAFLFLKGWPKRLTMIMAAVPLAIISNVTRLLMVILAAEMGGREWGNFVHENWFFSLIPYIPAIAGTMFLSRWFEEKRPASNAPANPKSTSSSTPA